MKNLGLIAAAMMASAGIGQIERPSNFSSLKPARKKVASRSREAGKRGAAGDKLARMAAEGRLGIRV